jgi:hypothetical protein
MYECICNFLTFKEFFIMKKKVFVSLLFAFVIAAAFANPWSYHGPKRDIVTLIVTANYEKPRLLAELIQVESRQPFLLLPANENGNIYFCPPKNFGNPKFIGRKKLGSIIAFIAPKNIIVLGNERYVSADYVKELRKIAPVMVVSAENWQLAADMVAPMLNLSKLPRSFRKLSAELESGRLYVPKKKNAADADEVLPAAADDNKDAKAPAAKDASAKENKEPEIAPLA